MTNVSTRTTYLIGFIVIVLLLSGAFYLQEFDGVQPCPLCVLQRICLAFIGVFFLIGGGFKFKSVGNKLIGVISSLFALTGVFLAGRQVWIQHLPADKNADCGVSLQYLMKVLPLDQVAKKIFEGSVECSQVVWQFLNLSLAEWSLICFGIFLLAAVFQTLRRND